MVEHISLIMCKKYLYSVNVNQGPLEDRALSTGLHTVCDIYCKNCLTVVGWKYVNNTNIGESLRDITKI
jgi:hypothetical protein